jgi:hypothetical protein
MPVLRALTAWLALILLEIVNGTLRVAFLVPRIGDLRARQFGVFTGSALILFVAWMFTPWLAARTVRRQLAVGLLWLALTLAFELLAGHYLFARPWRDLGADFDPRQGGLLAFGMGILALSPAIAARFRA